jgi:hypothetical protein
MSMKQRNALIGADISSLLKSEKIKNNLSDMIQGVHNRAVETTMQLVSAMYDIALHDVYGFGAGRLNKINEHVENTIQCIDAGTVDVDDLINEAKKIRGVMQNE